MMLCYVIVVVVVPDLKAQKTITWKSIVFLLDVTPIGYVDVNAAKREL